MSSERIGRTHMKICTAVLVAWLIVLCGCSFDTLSTDGGGTRGGNPVVSGTILTAGGVGAANVRVALIGVAYNPMTDEPIRPSCIDTTDAHGCFRIVAPDTGRYNIEAVTMAGEERLLVREVTVRVDSVTWVPSVALKRSGIIVIPLSRTERQEGGYVYIPGSSTGTVVTDSQDPVVLASVPAGVVHEVRYRSASTRQERIVRRSVMVDAGDTARIVHPFWEYSRTIVLNTSSTGASVAGDVYDFPVLIRLSGLTFVFGQTQSDGSDVRFAKHDGTPLPFEIERWDPSVGAAELWVRVDTVRGNNDSQSIVMYWGNPDALSVSSGAGVFDAAHGHAGVWHLDRTCTDATAYGRNGIPSGVEQTSGIIGYAQRFDGNGYVRIPGLLGTPQSMTLSAWVDLTAVEVTGAEVVSVGDAVLIRMDDVWNNKGTHGAFFVNPQGGVDSTHMQTKTGRFYKQTGWHHLTYTIDAAAATQSLYIDGALVSVTRSAIPIIYDGIGSDTYIGRHGNGRQSFDFTGRIDEVRVCSRCRSEHWIKLSFMNQRFDDQLVQMQ